MNPALDWLSVSATGAAVCALTWPLFAPRDERDVPASEHDRRQRLAERSFVYRHLSRLVAGLAEINRQQQAATVEKLGQSLTVLDQHDWQPAEFMAVKQLEAVPVALLTACLFGTFFTHPLVGVVIGLVALGVWPAVLLDHVKRKAKRHVDEARQRLPFALELMTLSLEAGAGTLRACLEQATHDDGGPLEQELKRALLGMEQGTSLTTALHTLQERLRDADVAEWVLTVNTAEARGVPLRTAFREQAERLRRRQVQWMEKSAEEAKVHITWPALVVMLACLLIIAAPLLLTSGYFQ
jgi:Flp pilus assembly protein TadB